MNQERDIAFRVFVVDDDLIIRELFEDTLGGDCTVETFPDAAACLDRVAVCRPELFIIDITMPGMDGYALCRHLKADWETDAIPVIFASSSDDIDARLASYEAGGDDFLLKPVDPAELLNKVRVASRIHQEKQALHEQAGYAQKTALSAMTSMGELGVVLQFLGKSFSCQDIRSLGEAALGALQQYDLLGAIQLRGDDQVLNLSQQGTNLPLESSVLNHVRDSGRIFQFKTRCVFNYGGITLLINNMPLDDPDRSGRIRDNVALLAEGVAARLQAIATERANHRRQQGIVEALPQVQTALEALQTNYRRNCFELTQQMIEYQEQMMKSFVHLGLTQEQENFLAAMAHDAMGRMIGTQDQNLGTITQLERLAADLARLAEG